jgi:DNA invertase Pin-like site-specific DNA recombinase
MIYRYARVSTAARDETGQVRQLRAAGCEKVFREKITGTTADRRSFKPIKALAPAILLSLRPLTGCRATQPTF